MYVDNASVAESQTEISQCIAESIMTNQDEKVKQEKYIFSGQKNQDEKQEKIFSPKRKDLF